MPSIDFTNNIEDIQNRLKLESNNEIFLLNPTIADLYTNPKSQHRYIKDLRKYENRDLEKYRQLIEWMFSIFKKLGLYGPNTRIIEEDIIAGKILNLSGEAIKKYRLGNRCYIPNKRTILKLLYLEKVIEQDLKTIESIKIR